MIETCSVTAWRNRAGAGVKAAISAAMRIVRIDSIVPDCASNMLVRPSFSTLWTRPPVKVDSRDLQIDGKCEIVSPAEATVRAQSMTDQSTMPRRAAAAAGEIRDHWRLLFFEGIVLITFGAFALILPALAIVAVNLLLGWLFLAVGVLGLGTTMMARQAPGFWWAIASAIASVIAGIFLTVWPMKGFYAVTIALAGFLFFDGLMMILFGIDHRRRLSQRWRWLVINGVVDLFLAPLILLVTFVAAAIWLLPEVIGIDLLFGGWSLVAVAAAAKPNDAA